MVPTDPDTLLTRSEFAAAITEAGFPTSPKTLASMATRGGGPPYQKFGPRALYRWGPGLAWAQSRLSPPISSTAELDVVLRSAAGRLSRGQFPPTDDRSDVGHPDDSVVDAGR